MASLAVVSEREPAISAHDPVRVLVKSESCIDLHGWIAFASCCG